MLFSVAWQTPHTPPTTPLAAFWRGRYSEGENFSLFLFAVVYLQLSIPCYYPTAVAVQRTRQWPPSIVIIPAPACLRLFGLVSHSPMT